VLRVVRFAAVMVVVVGLLCAVPAFAQGEAAADAPPAVQVKYFDFFVVKGGIIAYLLITLSVVMIALTIEHALSIRRATIVPPEAARRTKALIDERKYLEAVRFTAEDPSMLGCVVNASLLEAPNGFAAMQRALEETLDDRSSRLYRKIEYLNIIGAVSPMVGLFGTVFGMILLFAAIHAADSFPRAQVVADRVSIALVATFWGLAVAIPSLSMYAVFRNRIEVMSSECALTAHNILSVFKPTTPTMAARPPAAGRAPATAPTTAETPHA